MAVGADDGEVFYRRVEIPGDGLRGLGCGEETIGVKMCWLGHGRGCAMFGRGFQYLPYKTRIVKI